MSSKSGSAEEIISTVTQLVFLGAYLVGIVYVILFFVKGQEWAEDTVYPWIVSPVTLVFMLIVPAGILLSIFRRTRAWGGLGLFVSSYMLTFVTWLWCLGLAHELVGVGGMIIGLFFLGVGVIGAALIGALLHAEWTLAAVVAGFVGLIFVLRMTGSMLVDSAPAPEDGWSEPPPPETYDGLFDDFEDDDDDDDDEI